MAETTSEEYYNISRAADLAYSKISFMQRTVMSNNNSLSSSLDGLREHITQIEVTSARASSSLNAEMGKKTSKKDDKDEGEEFSVDGIIKGGSALLKMGMDMQQAQAAFEQLTGSASTAKALMGSLQEMGLSTPFNSADLMKNAQALMVAGTSAGGVVPTLTMLGEASRGNKDNLDAMTKAFIQVQADGKLTSETLKDMVGAGFNPLTQMAKDSGTSMADLRTQLEGGKITADRFTEALAGATGPGGQFFGTMQAQSETAAGKWQEFNERLEHAGASLGMALLPAASDFVNGALIPMASMLESVAGWLSENADIVGYLAAAIGGALIGYKLWAIWQGTLNLAMSLNPIGLIVAGVAALIGVLGYLWSSFAEIRGAVYGAWEWLKTFGSVIKDYVIDRIKGMISGISGLGQTLMYMFQGEWSKAWETGKNAMNDLVGTDAINNARQNLKKLDGVYTTEYNKEIKASIKIEPLKSKPAMPAMKDLLANAPVNTSTTTNAGGGLGGNARNKVDGITSGGSKNIIINLQKLFDNINISAATVREGVSDMEQIVTEALLRVLNSANVMEV